MEEGRKGERPLHYVIQALEIEDSKERFLIQDCVVCCVRGMGEGRLWMKRVLARRDYATNGYEGGGMGDGVLAMVICPGVQYTYIMA